MSAPLQKALLVQWDISSKNIIECGQSKQSELPRVLYSFCKLIRHFFLLLFEGGKDIDFYDRIIEDARYLHLIGGGIILNLLSYKILKKQGIRE